MSEPSTGIASSVDAMVLEFEDPCLLSAPLADSGFTLGWTLQTLYDNCEEFRVTADTNKVKNVS